MRPQIREIDEFDDEEDFTRKLDEAIKEQAPKRYTTKIRKPQAVQTVEDPSDILWGVYSIRSGTPLYDTIEQLLILNVKIEDIFEAIQGRNPEISREAVVRMCQEILTEWRQKGKAPVGDEKDQERGRAYVALLRAKRQAEMLHASEPSSQTLTVLMNIEKQLITLRSLDVKTNEVNAPVEEDAYSINNILKGLDLARLEMLRAALE